MVREDMTAKKKKKKKKNNAFKKVVLQIMFESRIKNPGKFRHIT